MNEPSASAFEKTAVEDTVSVSLVVPLTDLRGDPQDLFCEYEQMMRNLGRTYEIVFIMDGPREDMLKGLMDLQSTNPAIKIITLAKQFGDSTALLVGIDNTRGDVILQLPPYRQIDTDAIPELLNALEECDVAFARRSREQDSAFNRLQANVFSSIAGAIAGMELHDAGCEVRAFRREVTRDVSLYGDLHRFLPILAHRQGFRVREITLPQAVEDRVRRLHRPGVYLRRLIDLLSVFFLVKFTKKPLRFFGLVGAAVLTVGVLLTGWLVAERLFWGIGLSDRPALVLATLAIVLGVQIIAIGLIGEIIIFFHAKDVRDYNIEKIIEYDGL